MKPRSPLARASVWMFLAIFAFCAALTKGHFEGSDQMELYQTAQSLWEKGSLHTPGSFTIFRGRWLDYAHTSIGSAVLALPLYGAGKLADRALRAAGLDGVRNALAGPVIEINPTWRWGGEVPMFFVDLFPAIAVAGTCVLFFLFCLRLGAAPRWALAAALLLGTCSYFAYNGTEFFQHPAESFFLFLTVFLLSLDLREPSRRKLFFAGLSAAALFLCRWQAAIALPALALAAAWISSSRTPRDGGRRERLRAAGRGAAIFSAPVAAAIAVHLTLNFVKLGVVTIVPESASNEPYHFHFLSGLYGLIASPGAGILFFCPLLLLLPWTFPGFRRRFPFETALIAGLAGSYLIFYANYDYWSGQWCYGPRYITALVPLLFLPLPGWMERQGRRAWRSVAPLAFVGLVVVLLGAAVNYSYQYFAAGYANYKPLYGFVYSVRDSQLVTNAQAVLAGNHCVDLWLVRLFRSGGTGALLAAALPLAAIFGISLSKSASAARQLAPAGQDQDSSLPSNRFLRRAALTVGAAGVVATVVLFVVDIGWRQVDVPALMKDGMEALYTRHDPAAAVADFQRVLSLEPSHYGATFQLARALDETGHPDEAMPYWVRMRLLAAQSGDSATLRIVDERLARLSPAALDALMKAGMQALYDRNDPAAAVQIFQRVLAANPDHYGATYQIAVALDRVGKRSEARSYWQKSLALARAYRDESTIRTVEKRLAQAP
jgi:tetratricopeptide (TPR) repeat protein